MASASENQLEIPVSPAKPKRRTWKRKIFYCFLAVVLFFVLRAQWYYFSQEKIIVSKETTFLTEPLREDGTVDYVAAINARHKQGATPDNNAVVLLLEAVGPGVFPENIREKYYAEVNIPVPPLEGNYFQTLRDRSSELYLAEESQLLKDQSEGKRLGEYVDEIEQWDEHEVMREASSRPWSKDEFPILYEWMIDNRKAIELTIQAVERTEFYNPIVIAESDDLLDKVLLTADMSFQHKVRQLGEITIAQGMLEIKKENYDEAIQLWATVHKLANHCSEGAALIDILISYALTAQSFDLVKALIETGRLSQEQLDLIENTLREYTTLPVVSDCINFGERIVLLDSITQGFYRRNLSSANTVDEAGAMFPSGVGATYRVDWNLFLKTVNQHYDKGVELVRIPGYSECAKKSEEFSKQMKEKYDRLECDPEYLVYNVFLSREEFTTRYANYFSMLYLSHLKEAREAEERAKVRIRLLQLGVHLQKHFLREGKLPEQLESLHDESVSKLNYDPFNESPLIYKRTKRGSLLYTVGPNRIDEDGQGHAAVPRGDDFSIQIGKPE